MNDKLKYLTKNVGILTLSNFASKILVFLLVPLYTSVLSTEDVGIYDLVISTISLLYPILTLNIIDGVMRFSMDRVRIKEEIIAVAIRFGGISWIIGIMLLTIIRAMGRAPQIRGYEFLIYLYFTSYIFNQLLVQFAKGLGRVVDMGIAGVISTVAMLGGNILFLVVWRIGLSGFFGANILAQLLANFYLFYRFRFWRYLKKIKINLELQKDMLEYSVPLIATTLGWWINSALDKYVVAFICGMGASGLLSVAYKIPQIMNTLQGIFIQAWQISAIKEYGAEDTANFYGKTFKIINTFMCIACSCLILATKPLSYILYQNEFFGAWRYVPFLIVSSVLNSAAGILGPILSAKKDSRSMAMSAVYGGVTNIVLNIILVYWGGTQGATIATVISSFIIYAVRKKAVNCEITISGYRTILIVWSLLIIQAILEIYTRLWWVNFLITILIILINWNEIENVLKLGINLIRKGGVTR